MPPRPRAGSLLKASLLVLLAVFVWTAVRSFRTPGVESLNRTASSHLTEAVAALNDTSADARDRVTRYRELLREAEALLSRSLSAQPAQARTLAQLAVVRWELEPPLDDASRESYLAMIEMASRMAPGSPGVQILLGELMLKMGRHSDAYGYLARAIRLDPGTAGAAVEMLRDDLHTAEEMRAALPAIPEVVVALRDAYADERREGEYAGILEGFLASHDPVVLRRYGDVSLRLDRAGRLRDTLAALGELSGDEAEAERQVQIARAVTATGNPAAALGHARKARALRPGDPAIAEFLGNIALAARLPEAARDAFRDAIRLLARSSADPPGRARLYRLIGESEELGGDPGRAYDAYRQALALDPDEPVARRRIDEMQRAAGFR